MKYSKRNIDTILQGAFLLFGTSWLLAPVLNTLLSPRVTLISEYETSGQPYAWLFRTGDLLAAMILLYFARFRMRDHSRPYRIFLTFIAVAMAMDPLFITNCQVAAGVCQEHISFSFLLHAAETVISTLAVIALGIYDGYKTKRIFSIMFVALQVIYGLLFVSKFADDLHINTLTQVVYQTLTLAWLAWLIRPEPSTKTLSLLTTRKPILRYVLGIWAAVNGILAIVVSLSHLNLLGRFDNLYIANDTAWLAQHGVIIGVVLLYLSRHVFRGEIRARQIFMVLAGIEALKYSLITPNLVLLLVYIVSFVVLFVSYDSFDRGAVNLTRQLRIKDLMYFIISLMIAGTLATVLLDRDTRVATITSRSINHYGTYLFRSMPVRHNHLESALLADTYTAFLMTSVAAILWTLFKPSTSKPTAPGRVQPAKLLARYSQSSEDYFKIWPKDVQQFSVVNITGFIAYKIAGPITYALPDPIAPASQKTKLVNEFIVWSRANRQTACFVAVPEGSTRYYNDLPKIQVGATAQVNIADFQAVTIRNKWWRWKMNKARGLGYSYAVSQPPHSPKLILELSQVSHTWLANGRQERGFGLGYFDLEYLNQCSVHYVIDSTGHAVAFANQLPNLRPSRTTTIDMLRFHSDHPDSMPYLLASLITNLDDTYKYFDLGFVPFAKTGGYLQKIAQSLSAKRFSSKGLEQFKNKFEPTWHPCYVVYDGDPADLAQIALHLDEVMKIE